MTQSLQNAGFEKAADTFLNSKINSVQPVRLRSVPNPSFNAWLLSLAPLSQSAQAPQTGGRCTSTRSSRFWRLEAEIGVPAWSGSGEGPLPGLQTATFSLCPRMADRERECSLMSLWKGTNPIMRTPTPPHLTLLTSQRPHLQITLEVKASTYEWGWGGEHNSVHSAPAPLQIHVLLTCR